ncbi:2-iminobutanoate/2-iminopropanoate deaminase [Paenibacillus sp. UNCCL117]|uniref:RidA family protein n=1 Tax=unclassified Paenibacillus TaxID=185978 RepID=UPI00087E0BEE|nr:MULTISPECIES: RidA family protein [unclassified Paenibacillus]SDE10391.1 2-iminobutanoate/2-iminopropanoate deaminase [Paenibacillus sp. cl123]SFW59753.1 2-iminobutanoate/2-iminopropanoate deaminase [Paenibacillus sp. UNCCL117]
MNMEIIRTDKAPQPAGSYSQAVKFGNMVYVAGTCPFELGSNKVMYPGRMEEQTKLVLTYMSAVLQEAGSSLKHVLKVTAFLDDLDAFGEYNKAYAEFFPIDPPARSTVEIGKFPPGMRVEIECTAYIPE